MRRANSVCGICKNPRRARLHPQTTTFPSAKWVGCCVSAHVSNKTLMNNHLVKSCGYDIIVSFLHPPIYSFVTFLLFTFLTLCKSILKSSNHICKSAIKPIIKVPNPSNGRALCSWTCHGMALESCLTLCDLMDYSLPGSSVHGILQARILEWVVMPSSRGSSQPRDQTSVSYVSCIGRWVLYH